MKIVKTTDTSLNIIPGEYPSDVSVSIRGESTNTTTTFETPVTTSGGYLNVPYTFSFIEGNFYELEVNLLTGERIYKDKIFCTDQDNYSINDGKYKERSVQREYITR